MTWVQFGDGLRLDPVAKRSPEALVALLHDVGDFAATLTPVAARWAVAVPTTSFIALEGIEQRAEAMPPGAAGSPDLDRAVRHLVPRLEQQLSFYRLDASRLVLVGFGYGGTLALHLLLRQGRSCAGVLAFAATLARPLPRIHGSDQKVRLIESLGTGHIGRSSLRDVVAWLTARGIDTRGAALAGSPMSDEAIRHGGAYLVELIATAQQGKRFHINRERSHAH
jgi:hypothetical protein